MWFLMEDYQGFFLIFLLFSSPKGQYIPHGKRVEEEEFFLFFLTITFYSIMKEKDFLVGGVVVENKNGLVHKTDIVDMCRTHKITLISKHDNFPVTIISS